MQGSHLVYFADPMCSWCWGFSPVIEAIRARFGDTLPIRLVLGGLRPGTETEMDAGDRAEVRSHWEHVHEASGQPFDFRFFERSHFVYDTEPASRAVVVMRRLGMDVGLAALKRVQAAFYAENLDVTDAATLAILAAELGMDTEAFRADFGSETSIRETWRDFQIAQSAGVRGFPTLIAGAGDEGRYALVTHGFQPAARILPALERWFETVKEGQA
ncbi:MAG TPA: DsbA family protein [Rhodopila sp.]|nr:DsbA family protein [Rhodopila sp.]